MSVAERRVGKPVLTRIAKVRDEVAEYLDHVAAHDGLGEVVVERLVLVGMTEAATRQALRLAYLQDGERLSKAGERQLRHGGGAALDERPRLEECIGVGWVVEIGADLTSAGIGNLLAGDKSALKVVAAAGRRYLIHVKTHLSGLVVRPLYFEEAGLADGVFRDRHDVREPVTDAFASLQVRSGGVRRSMGGTARPLRVLGTCVRLAEKRLGLAPWLGILRRRGKLHRLDGAEEDVA